MVIRRHNSRMMAALYRIHSAISIGT